MNKTIAEQQAEIIKKQDELRELNIDKDLEWIEKKEKEIKDLIDIVMKRVQNLIDNHF